MTTTGINPFVPRSKVQEGKQNPHCLKSQRVMVCQPLNLLTLVVQFILADRIWVQPIGSEMNSHDSHPGGCAYLSAHGSGFVLFGLVLDYKFNVGRHLSLWCLVFLSSIWAQLWPVLSLLKLFTNPKSWPREPSFASVRIIYFCARDLQSVAIITVAELKGSRRP